MGHCTPLYGIFTPMVGDFLRMDDLEHSSPNIMHSTAITLLAEFIIQVDMNSSLPSFCFLTVRSRICFENEIGLPGLRLTEQGLQRFGETIAIRRSSPAFHRRKFLIFANAEGILSVAEYTGLKKMSLERE
jgi:hypothetical protein